MDILDKKMLLTPPFRVKSSPSHERDGDMFVYFLNNGVHCYWMEFFLSTETPEWLRGFENVSSADIDKVVRNKWVKLRF